MRDYWGYIAGVILMTILAVMVYMKVQPLSAGSNECKGTVHMKVRIDEPLGKRVRLWLPYPLSGEYQTISSLSYTANTKIIAAHIDEKKGLGYLYAEWVNERAPRTLELNFNVATSERTGGSINCCALHARADAGNYLAADHHGRPHGRIKEIARAITGGKTDVLAKARAIYDWTVANIARDPEVKGCGTGTVERVLAEGSGKCVDISSVFIALSRASGIPAREVFGIRLPRNADKDISGDFHCWAEFYNPPTGWVAVDPADVRRVMLNGNLDLAKAKPYADYYFGAVDQYRVALGCGGRDVHLAPAQDSGALNYFMYPHAEVGGMALDQLDPKGFYSIDYKEL